MYGEVLYKIIKQIVFVDKFDIFGFLDSSALENKIRKLATKAELKSDQDKITKLEVLNLKFARS